MIMVCIKIRYGGKTILLFEQRENYKSDALPPLSFTLYLAVIFI